MRVYSFHMAQVSPLLATKAMMRGLPAAEIDGLLRAEPMTAMRLGAPVFSPARLQLRHLAVFASWENEAALDRFLGHDPLGVAMARGWHVRLEYLRRWGEVAEFADLPAPGDPAAADEPVAAVTLAKLKFRQLPRFIKWGQPAERLVRDHPGTRLALTAMRLPRTVSTFSIWHSTDEMTDMVRGHSDIAEPQRHTAAMAAQRRKDFHFEFTTLRFRLLSEHGAPWFVD